MHRLLFVLLSLSLAPRAEAQQTYPMAAGAKCGLVFQGRRVGGDINVVHDRVYLAVIGPTGVVRVRTLPVHSQAPEWTEAMIAMARQADVSAGALIRLNRPTQTIEFGRFQVGQGSGSSIVREAPVSYLFTAPGEFVVRANDTGVGGACVMYGRGRR